MRTALFTLLALFVASCGRLAPAPTAPSRTVASRLVTRSVSSAESSWADQVPLVARADLSYRDSMVTFEFLGHRRLPNTQTFLSQTQPGGYYFHLFLSHTFFESQRAYYAGDGHVMIVTGSTFGTDVRSVPIEGNATHWWFTMPLSWLLRDAGSNYVHWQLGLLAVTSDAEHLVSSVDGLAYLAEFRSDLLRQVFATERDRVLSVDVELSRMDPHTPYVLGAATRGGVQFSLYLDTDDSKSTGTFGGYHGWDYALLSFGEGDLASLLLLEYSQGLQEWRIAGTFEATLRGQTLSLQAPLTAFRSWGATVRYSLGVSIRGDGGTTIAAQTVEGVVKGELVLPATFGDFTPGMSLRGWRETRH